MAMLEGKTGDCHATVAYAAHGPGMRGEEVDAGQCSTCAPAKRLFIRINRKTYPEVLAYLGRDQGFDDLVLIDGDKNPLSRRGRWSAMIVGVTTLLRHLPEIRQAQTIVSAPKNVTALLKVMALFGMVKAKVHLGWAFFSHSPKTLRLFRAIARMDGQRDRYVVYSQVEAEQYSAVLDRPLDRFLVLPYSDWDQRTVAHRPVSKRVETGRYFFSGGYSNRDYPALIDVFRRLPDQRLVIVCSSINHELDHIALPPNVEVHRDLPGVQFDAWLQGATACILPIKNREGAAGQAVLVACLKHSVPLVVIDTAVTRSYVRHGESGYLVETLDEIAPLLPTLQPDTPAYRQMAEAGRALYESECSYGVVAQRVANHLQATSAP